MIASFWLKIVSFSFEGFVQQQGKETFLGLENANICAKTESSLSLTWLDHLLNRLKSGVFFLYR